jgi:hypothetical protein
MSILESLILMSGLVFSLNLLYWSKQKWGLALATVMLVSAIGITLYWPLMAGAGIGLLCTALLRRYNPVLASGEGRENRLREWVQHLMALAMLLVGIQYLYLNVSYLPIFGVQRGIYTRSTNLSGVQF